MPQTKSYKPEISECPLCGSKLKYRYPVSDKVIQFSHGETIRIKNLGYSCKNINCPHPEYIYVSHTARKMCIKGYTYSSKILASILEYKHFHKSREEIADMLADEGVEISDRNVDIIWEKLGPMLDMNYKRNIEYEYEMMERECGGIYLSIDSIGLSRDTRFWIIRNFFTSNVIGCHLTNDTDYSILDDYLNKDLNIKLIITIRPRFKTFDEIKNRCNDNVKFLEYEKF